jgi:nucleotide-binding universal stress UspA family protein
MRVLIGVDGSEGGWEAVYQAARLISPDRDQVALYYAPPQIAFRRGRSPEQAVIDQARQGLAESVLGEAVQRLPNVWRANVEKIVGHQHPREGLKIAADQWRADMIVVGARGSGPIQGLVLGSVSRAIVRCTLTPVMVARRKHDKRSDPTYRVLMAVDQIPETAAPIDYLARITWPRDTVGRLIHVVEPLFGAELPAWLEEKASRVRDEVLAEAWLNEHQAEKRHKFEELSTYNRQLPAPFASNPPIVLEGIPAEKVIETAQADDIDLVIVTTSDPGPWRRFMLGSTAEKILLHAPCSVLVMHSPKQA